MKPQKRQNGKYTKITGTILVKISMFSYLWVFFIFQLGWDIVDISQLLKKKHAQVLVNE